MTRITQNKNDSINSILPHGHGSRSYFRIYIFGPVSQTMQIEGSYHLLSYKDQEQLKHWGMKLYCY